MTKKQNNSKPRHNTAKYTKRKNRKRYTMFYNRKKKNRKTKDTKLGYRSSKNHLIKSIREHAIEHKSQGSLSNCLHVYNN